MTVLKSNLQLFLESIIKLSDPKKEELEKKLDKLLEEKGET